MNEETTVKTELENISTPAPAPAAVETPTPQKSETPAVAKEPQSIRSQIEASMKTVRDKPRDDAGRFALETKVAAKSDTKAMGVSPAPGTTAEEPKPGVQPESAKPMKVDRPADMPKAWGADKGVIWSALTPDQRTYVNERETQMEGFHAKFGGLSQWHDAATANNTTLPEVLERVNQVETTMIRDPAQGLVMACQMVGLDQQDAVRALSTALQRLGVQVGPRQAAPAAQPNGQTPPVQQPQQIADPRLEQLTQEVQNFKRFLGEQTQAKALEAQARAGEQVKAFAADTKNKYFHEVAADVAAELRAMKATGQQLDLAKAYESALWKRADIRDKIVADQVSEKLSAANSTKTQELEKARLASRSVAGSPPSAEGRSSADRPNRLRDEIAMHVRNAGGRA